MFFMSVPKNVSVVDVMNKPIRDVESQSVSDDVKSPLALLPVVNNFK